MDNVFDEMDFGPLQQYLDNDDVTDISYSNGGHYPMVYLESKTQVLMIILWTS